MVTMHCIFCKGAELAQFDAAIYRNLPPYLAAAATKCAECQQAVCVALSAARFVPDGTEERVRNNSYCPLCTGATLVNIVNGGRVRQAFPQSTALSGSSMQACTACHVQAQTVPLVQR